MRTRARPLITPGNDALRAIDFVFGLTREGYLWVQDADACWVCGYLVAGYLACSPGAAPFLVGDYSDTGAMS